MTSTRALCLLLGTLLLGTLMASPPAGAASPIADVICEPRAQMAQRLTSRLGATLSAKGLRNPEEVVELWTDAEGDWTMVIAYSSGASCIVAMGEHWTTRSAPMSPPTTKDPA